MNLEDFKNRYIDSFVDVDAAYGAQCYDLVVSYWKEVHGLFEAGNPICAWTGGVIDFFHYFSKIFDDSVFELVANNPDDFNQLPPPGSVYILNEGYLGHTGIVYSATTEHFMGLDQNWGAGADGSGNGEKRIRVVMHDYDKLLGWIIVKGDTVQSSLPSVATPTLPELQQQLVHKTLQIDGLQATISNLTNEIAALKASKPDAKSIFGGAFLD
jgi:hypothetical protein